MQAVRPFTACGAGPLPGTRVTRQRARGARLSAGNSQSPERQVVRRQPTVQTGLHIYLPTLVRIVKPRLAGRRIDIGMRNPANPPPGRMSAPISSGEAGGRAVDGCSHHKPSRCIVFLRPSTLHASNPSRDRLVETTRPKSRCDHGPGLARPVPTTESVPADPRPSFFDSHQSARPHSVLIDRF